MKMFKQFNRAAVLGLLLAITIPVQADDLQDANKLFKQKQYGQALSKVNAFLAANPKDAQARFLKGLIFTELNSTDKAIEIFTGLTEDYPELPEPYNNLAVIYAGQGKYEKAKNALEMAIRTHPTYATAYENLGDIYAKMASQAYDRALQLNKNNASTKTKLALIRKLFGNNARTAKPKAGARTRTAPPKPAVTVLEREISNEVLKATLDWAATWSAKDIDKYLAFYTKDFKMPGASHSAWVAQRKARLADPKFIQVKVLDARTTVVNDNQVSVSFRQHYRSSGQNSSFRKTLDWVKIDGQWLIAQEHSGN